MFKENLDITYYVKTASGKSQSFNFPQYFLLTTAVTVQYGCNLFPFFIVEYWISSGFGGLGVACWPLVPKFADSNPAEAVGFLRAKKSSARLPSEGK